jgi:hypothetical protein
MSALKGKADEAYCGCAFDPKRTCFALTNPEEQAHCGGPGKGRCMALETNTFLMILAASIMAMGIVVWVMFKKAS